MNAMTKAEQPTITQADRDAAFQYMKLVDDHRWSWQAILDGHCDNTSIVLALARHRTTSAAQSEITPEWCLNMAKQEEGDIGAGLLAMDPAPSLAAQDQQVLALVEAARDAGDVLQSAASPSNLDPQYSDQITALGERIGYGALMHGASALWRQALGDLAGSELAAGPCVSTAVSRLARLDDALMPFRGETLPAAPSLAAQDGLVEALRCAVAFVEALADNEPDEPIADNGMTVLSKLQYDAPQLIFKMRAALSAWEAGQ